MGGKYVWKWFNDERTTRDKKRDGKRIYWVNLFDQREKLRTERIQKWIKETGYKIVNRLKEKGLPVVIVRIPTPKPVTPEIETIPAWKQNSNYIW